VKKYDYDAPLIISDYLSGMSIAEVGKKHLCSGESARKILRDNGIVRDHKRGTGQRKCRNVETAEN